MISENQKKLESLIKRMETNEIENLKNTIKENCQEINCIFQKIYLESSNQFLLTKDAQNKLFNDIEILNSNYSKMLEIYEKMLKNIIWYPRFVD